MVVNHLTWVLGAKLGSSIRAGVFLISILHYFWRKSPQKNKKIENKIKTLMCRKLYMPARDPRKSPSDEEKYTVCNIEKYHFRTQLFSRSCFLRDSREDGHYNVLVLCVGGMLVSNARILSSNSSEDRVIEYYKKLNGQTRGQAIVK